MRHFRRVKRDANHREIVEALEAVGCTVVDLAAVGGGVSDLLVGYGHTNLLLEVKNPAARAGKKRGKTQAETDSKQMKFRRTWRGQSTVVESAEGAVRYVTAGQFELDPGIGLVVRVSNQPSDPARAGIPTRGEAAS